MYSYFLRRFCSQRFVDQSQCYNATRVVSADGLTLVKQQQYPKSWDSLLHVLRCTTHVLRFITVKAICHAISPTGTSGYDAGEWLGWLGWNHRTSALREEQYVIRCGQQIVVHYPLHPTECACHVTVSTTGTVRTATGKLGWVFGEKHGVLWRKQPPHSSQNCFKTTSKPEMQICIFEFWNSHFQCFGTI